LYGLSCFENMPVESELERGARMKSVGILSASYLSLYCHTEFLVDQVRYLLRNPGSYQDLQEFYTKWKAILPAGMSSGDLTCIPKHLCPKVVHPAGCFSQFVNFFGDQIFLLWKCVLLKKRILFYSPPPIGVVCFRVYFTNCLAFHNAPEIVDKIVHPLFYVSVGDIDFLEDQISYVACTTDKILEAKPQLYDVYVDNQNVKCDVNNFHKLLSLTPSDRDKLRRLTENLKQLSKNQIDRESSEELIFTNYFRNLNTRLFRMLLDVSYSQDKQLTSNHIRSIGLDPINDRNFLIELLETYGIDAMIMAESPCCI